MTAKVVPQGASFNESIDLDTYDQQLMTAVVQVAERAGKEVKPLIVPTNNPFHAVMRTAKSIQAHEVIMGASNKYTADEQMDQIAFYWITLHDGQEAPLTVRIGFTTSPPEPGRRSVSWLTKLFDLSDHRRR